MKSILVTAGVLVSYAGIVLAQTTESPAHASQMEAADVLARGIEAHGGFEQLRSVTSVLTRLNVIQYSAGQSPSPTAAAGQGRPVVYVVTLDFEGDRFLLEAVGPGGQVGARAVDTEDDTFIYVAGNNSVRDLDEAYLARITRGLPYVGDNLLDAWARMGTLRSLGRHEVDGTAYDVITYADEVGEQVTMYFDAGTELLARIEFLAPDEPFGVAVQQVGFSDYREIGGTQQPYVSTTSVRGSVRSRAECQEMVLGAELDESVLTRPEGAEEQDAAADAPNTARAYETEELAQGVFLMRNVQSGYHAMFVEQDDHVIVVETPGNPVVSRSVMKTVEQVVPGKPIRFAVLTHHHYDHSGGLWPYFEKGITVITTPGNVEFVRSIAAVPRVTEKGVTSAPDPVIETVEGKRVYGSGANTMELYDVGPNPHATEILVVYFPAHKMLYVPDIYGYMPNFTPPPLLASFAQRLSELDLDVETFVTAHTEPTTKEEYDVAVQQATTPASP